MARRHLLNPDCWHHVLKYLKGDHNAHFQLLLTCKTLFRLVVPVLYRRPLFDFQDLAYRKKQALEELLLAPIDSQFFGLTVASGRTVDYYHFVKEMPDRPVVQQAPRALLTNELKRRLEYLRLAGSKVRKVVLFVGEFISLTRPWDNPESMAVVKESLLFLGSIEELEFQDPFYYGQFDKVTQVTYDAVKELICLHRTAFPDSYEKSGLLKRIQYRRSQEALPYFDDPQMMAVIRDAVGNDGQDTGGKGSKRWMTDTISLRFLSTPPQNEELDALLSILKDPDLPKQLKFLAIRPAAIGGSLPVSIVSALASFLSRCRDLDSVEIESCLPELLAWAEQEQSATRSTDTRKLAQWRSITIMYDKNRSRGAEIVAQEEQVSKTWFNLLRGFRHSMESLSFTHFRSFTTGSPFKLCLPPSMGFFPKLEELYILSGEFADFSGANFPVLRKLRFEIHSDIMIYGKHDVSVAPTRKFPKSLKDLYINDRTLAQKGIELLQQLPELRELMVQPHGSWDEQEAFGQTHNSRMCIDMSAASKSMNVMTCPSLLLGNDLPKLSKVTLRGYCAQYIGLDILLIAPNIQHLVIDREKDNRPSPKHNDHNNVLRRRSGCCDIGNGNRFLAMDKFFSKVGDRATGFPKLQTLKVGGFVDIQPCELIKLVSLPRATVHIFSRCRTKSARKASAEAIIRRDSLMFPALKHLALGSIQHPIGGEKAKEFVKLIEEGFSFLERCQREASGRRKIIAESKTLSRQSLLFQHSKLEPSTQREWHSLLRSEEMGFEVLPVEQRRPGLAIQLNNPKVVYQRKKWVDFGVDKR